MDTRDPNSLCSTYFRYADLIECGETAQRLDAHGARVANLPTSVETWDNIAALARVILDPLTDRFGTLVLTYGLRPVSGNVTSPGVAPGRLPPLAPGMEVAPGMLPVLAPAMDGAADAAACGAWATPTEAARLNW